MAFCGRGWSERALDPDPHDLLIRGWAALVRPISTTTRQDALRIFAFAARFQDTELQPRRARRFPNRFDVRSVSTLASRINAARAVIGDTGKQ
jgi:hypothetical protein